MLFSLRCPISSLLILLFTFSTYTMHRTPTSHSRVHVSISNCTPLMILADDYRDDSEPKWGMKIVKDSILITLNTEKMRWKILPRDNDLDLAVRLFPATGPDTIPNQIVLSDVHLFPQKTILHFVQCLCFKTPIPNDKIPIILTFISPDMLDSLSVKRQH